MFVIVKS